MNEIDFRREQFYKDLRKADAKKLGLEYYPHMPYRENEDCSPLTEEDKKRLNEQNKAYSEKMEALGISPGSTLIIGEKTLPKKKGKLKAMDFNGLIKQLRDFQSENI
jgi:predicted ATP-grasp superfamily ATP-dependent carboligase